MTIVDPFTGDSVGPVTDLTIGSENTPEQRRAATATVLRHLTGGEAREVLEMLGLAQ